MQITRAPSLVKETHITALRQSRDLRGAEQPLGTLDFFFLFFTHQPQNLSNVSQQDVYFSLR